MPRIWTESWPVDTRSLPRRGIGRTLVRHSLRQATEAGYTAMMFNLVMETNPSRRLYESLGFEVIGSIPNVHGNESALIYWRKLAPEPSGQGSTQ
jgi:ribosomal protein S18 acetylase RimI-like enzyme